MFRPPDKITGPVFVAFQMFIVVALCDVLCRAPQKRRNIEVFRQTLRELLDEEPETLLANDPDGQEGLRLLIEAFLRQIAKRVEDIEWHDAGRPVN